MPDIETGAQLKKRRESKGLTQGKLGAALDYAEKSIARLEGQKTIPRVVGLAAAVVLDRVKRRRRRA